MTPVQWLAIALAVLGSHATSWWWGWVVGQRQLTQRAYDAAYADGVTGTYRRPSSVDATVGPVRLRTVPLHYAGRAVHIEERDGMRFTSYE